MKPTKMRNMQIYRATYGARSRRLGAALSAELRKRHGMRSVRVVEGDTVRVARGEYKDVTGKVSRVSTAGARVAIDGVKKEKGQGEKFDVMIHASNVVVTALDMSDPWRARRITGAEPAKAAEGAPRAAELTVKSEEDVPKAAETTVKSEEDVPGIKEDAPRAEGDKAEAGGAQEDDAPPGKKDADAAKSGGGA